jgi:hypothetical protein
VDGEGAEHREHHGGERHPERIAQHRVVEDVPPDVHLVFRILDAEAPAVAEEHPVLPPALRGQAREEADDQREHGDPGAEARRDDHAVALECRLFGGVRPQHRAQAVGEVEVPGDDQRDNRADDQEEKEAGEEDTGEDVDEIDLVEPEVIGVRVDAPPEQREKKEDPDQDADGDATASAHPWQRAVTHNQRRLHISVGPVSHSTSSVTQPSTAWGCHPR